MPYVFSAQKGTQAGLDTNKVQFSCCVNTDGTPPDKCNKCLPCQAQTRSGRRCKIITCRDSDLCHIHLKSLNKIVIAPSRVVQGGLGLFAWTHRNIGVSERVAGHPPIFKKGDIITSYGGEILSRNDMNRRYDYLDPQSNKIIQPTAPYGLYKSKEEVYDGACRRRGGVYANDYRSSGQQYINAYITTAMNLKATRNIYKGDEILINYHKGYWKTHGREWLTHSTKYVRPVKKPL